MDLGVPFIPSVCVGRFPVKFPWNSGGMNTGVPFIPSGGMGRSRVKFPCNPGDMVPGSISPWVCLRFPIGSTRCSEVVVADSLPEVPGADCCSAPAVPVSLVMQPAKNKARSPILMSNNVFFRVIGLFDLYFRGGFLGPTIRMIPFVSRILFSLTGAIDGHWRSFCPDRLDGIEVGRTPCRVYP